MLLLIPVGGLGTRFSKYGYSKPKPLINVLGKPIICWLLDNLNLENISNIIIPYNKRLKEYRFEDFLKKKYPDINFIFIYLENDTAGASHTILLGLNKLELNNFNDESLSPWYDSNIGDELVTPEWTFAGNALHTFDYIP